MNQQLLQEYNRFLSHDQNRLAKIKSTITQLAVLRLLAFIVFLFSLIFLPKFSPWLAYSLAGTSLILFLYWIKVFLKKEKEKIFFGKLVKINQHEIRALEEDYSQFEDGREFIDPHHPYTFDLDIFGEGSVFQFINRTTTQLGKKKLAKYLKQTETDIPKLKERQEALLELAKYIRWRQYFSAKGNTKDVEDLELLGKISAVVEIRNARKLEHIRLLLSAATLVIFALYLFAGLSWGFLAGILLINGILLYAKRKVIQSLYILFGSEANLLANYKELLKLIEEKEFKSVLLVDLRSRLLSEEFKASEALNRLQKSMAEFDYRGNLIIAVILNALLLWDLRCSLKLVQLVQWQKKYGASIHCWFDVIAEFDALSSLANLDHNHPEWTLPKFEDGDFHLTANDLKHPLIKSSKNIGNDFRMNGTGQIAIVTGANMAGKSTFLRTVGVNIVLAMNGCRANASWLGLKPVGLFTNMRTTDNLQNDESYFFAELQRLKAILDQIKAGKEVFVVIDEMLKGTNSEDKLSGSIKLIEQLISLGAVGLVATHDLKLTSMAEKYPLNITNKCFEIQLSEDELLFDYKLTDGVTSTMNANFLMKKMGIIS